MQARLPALAALAVPVICGAAWMAAGGAPAHYAPVNLAALVIALGWAAFGSTSEAKTPRRILAAVLLAVLAAPIVTGPVLLSETGEPVSRWIPLGPLALHSGMLTVPALAVLAARERSLAAPILLAALFFALVQPDAASGFALTIGAAGLHHVARDWRVGAAAIAGFAAFLVMATRGPLPPQPFVERVIVAAAVEQPVFAVLLGVALLISFLLVLFHAPLERRERFALAGTLFGFAAMATMGAYPSVLIGYGAAPILGFGLALGLVKKDKE